MFKPVMQVAATGIVAFFLWKLAAILLLPLLGVAVGIVAFLIKLAFMVVGVVIVVLIIRWLAGREAAAG
ncbi:MAG: hypothetical protein ABJD11_00230 [Gemmatimonadota bacterium]